MANGVRNYSERVDALAGSSPAPSAIRLDGLSGLRILAIVNSAAGGDPEFLLDQLIEGSADRVIIDVFRTSGPGDAERLASSLTDSMLYLMIVAIGGDGTVREIVSGLRQANILKQPVLLVAPAGTGNSNYRAFWEDAPWEEVVRSIFADNIAIRSIDLAYIEELQRVVVLGAGVGVIADGLVTARNLQGSGRDLYLQAAFETLQNFQPVPVRVSVDGIIISDSNIINISIGGGRYRAGNFQPLPRSFLDDHALDVSVLEECDRPLEAAALALSGDFTEHDAVKYGRGRRVVIERLDGEFLRLEHDGDVMPIERSAYTVDLLPAALTVCVKSPLPAWFQQTEYSANFG